MKKKCFECGSTENIHEHHVVPRCRGGKKTIPICKKCHNLCHHENGNMTTRKLSKVKTKKTKNIGHIMKSEVFFSSIAKIKNKEPSFYEEKIFMLSPAMTNFFPHHREKEKIHFSITSDYKNKIYSLSNEWLPTGILPRKMFTFLIHESIKNKSNIIKFENTTDLAKKYLCRLAPNGADFKNTKEILNRLSDIFIEIEQSEVCIYRGKIIDNFSLEDGFVTLEEGFFSFCKGNCEIIDGKEIFSFYPSSMVVDIYLLLNSKTLQGVREEKFFHWKELRKILNKEHTSSQKVIKQTISNNIRNIENPCLKLVYGGVSLVKNY